jgi:hypothetical protein
MLACDKRSNMKSANGNGSKTEKARRNNGATTVIVRRKASDLDAAKRLEKLESTIRRGMQEFMKVGSALAEVKRDRLFEVAGYESFEDYARDKFGFEKTQSYGLVNAASTVERLSAIAECKQLPSCEGQVRPLARLQPEQAARVWKQALKQSKQDARAVTARVVQEVASSMFPKRAKSNAKKHREKPAARAAVKASALALLGADALKKKMRGEQIALLILNGRADESAKLVDRLAPFVGTDGVVVAQARCEDEADVLDAMDRAGLNVLGRVNLYDDLKHSASHRASPGSAHRALWIAGKPNQSKGTKLLLPDPLNARGKTGPDGSWPAPVTEILVKQLSKKGEIVVISVDTDGAAAGVINRLGRKMLFADEQAAEKPVLKKAA